MSIWRLPGSQEGASSLHCHLCLLQLSPALSEGEAPDQFLWYKCQALKTLSSSVWSSPHLTHTAPVGRTGTAANSTFGAWKWRVKAIPQNCHTGTVTLLISHRSQSQYLRQQMSVIHWNPPWTKIKPWQGNQSGHKYELSINGDVRTHNDVLNITKGIKCRCIKEIILSHSWCKSTRRIFMDIVQVFFIHSTPILHIFSLYGLIDNRHTKCLMSRWKNEGKEFSNSQKKERHHEASNPPLIKNQMTLKSLVWGAACLLKLTPVQSRETRNDKTALVTTWLFFNLSIFLDLKK